MKMDGATVIYLQRLQNLPLHPDHRVQGKRNWVLMRDLGVSKGPRIRRTLGEEEAKSGTTFMIPDDKVTEVFKALGICK